jgi:hypothetical protein
MVVGDGLVAISIPTKLSLLPQGVGGLMIIPSNVILLKATRVTKRKYLSEILTDNTWHSQDSLSSWKDNRNRPAMLYVRSINW